MDEVGGCRLRSRATVSRIDPQDYTTVAFDPFVCAGSEPYNGVWRNFGSGNRHLPPESPSLMKGRINMTALETPNTIKGSERRQNPPRPSPLPPRPPRRNSGRLALILVTFAVVSVSLGYIWLNPTAAVVSAETWPVARRTFAVTLNEKGELEAKNSVDVKCEVEGRSTIIWLIPEGTEVKEGDLLVKLASNEIDERIRAEQIKVQNSKAAAEAAVKELEITRDQCDSDIRKAKLAVRNAEVELNKYLEGDSKQQMKTKATALNTAEIRLEQAVDVEKDSLALREKGHLSKREYERDKLTLIEAQAAVDNAKLDLEIFNKYTHPKNLEQKESDVNEAKRELERTVKQAAATIDKQEANTKARQAEYELTQGRLDKLLEQQKKTEIHAPASGLVVYDSGRNHWDRRQIAEGVEVYERQGIIKLPDPAVMMVKLRIHEAKTSEIRLGQKATVEVEGLPGQTFTGEVTKIAPLADSQNRWLNPDLKEYATEVTLDPTDVELKPGVTARAEIMVREVDNVITIPIQAAFSSRGKSYAFIGTTESNAMPVEIEVGHASNKYVEVRSGLSEGDTVLLAANDALLALIPSDSAASEDTHQEPKHASNATKRTKGKKQRTVAKTDTERL